MHQTWGGVSMDGEQVNAAAAELHSAPTQITTDPLSRETWGELAAPGSRANGRFDVDINFTGDSSFRAVFDRAADRWESIITSDLTDVTFDRVFIDDLRIDASVVAIDGPGGILGQAGPTNIRIQQSGATTIGGLPFKGQMQFDSADMATMQTSGILDDVILHEMGHVLGIGTLWRNPFTSYIGGPWDRYTNNPANQLANSTFQYTGGNANGQFQSYGGSGLTPIADVGGAGSIGSHWRESVFDTELMTPNAESTPPMPLSRITIGSLQDMGYAVNLGSADSYAIPGTDTTAPNVTSLSVNGSSLVLTLNETLRSTIPSVSRFNVLVNGVSRSVNTASVDTNNRTVTLSLASPVTAGQSVTLAYTDPSSGNDTSGVIEDAAGNDLASFTASAVANNTPGASDDFSGDTSTTGTVAVNGSTNGNLETPTDSDWFRMTLNAGTAYTFRQNATTSGLDSFLRLRNASGAELASNDDGGGNGNSLITFTPTTSGTYFLDAGSFNRQTSSRYTVSASAQAAGTNWWDGGRFGELWGFEQSSDKDIDAATAFASWGSPSGGIPNTNAGQNKVAVLDTGIRGTHQDLNMNYIGGFDFVNNDNDPSDGNGHGTHCAGTIGAMANSIGVVGANPAAKLLAVKVLGDNGGGSTSGLINGINYAVQQGAKVLSMSLGFPLGANPGTALESALAAAGAAGCLSIIAAGNDNNNNDITPTFPASYTDPSIIVVAASNDSDTKASFSSYGSISVDIYAPGQSILSADHGSDSSYSYKSGTSMATPLVAGIVSAYWSRNPNLSASQVKSRLMQSVDTLPFTRNTVTGGRINMAKMFGLTSTSALTAANAGSEMVDSLTGMQTGEATGNTSLGDNQTTLDSRDNFYGLSDINTLNAASVAQSDNIIVFLSGNAAERSKDARALEIGVDGPNVNYKAFDEYDSMQALGNSLAILSVTDQTTGRGVVSDLKDMLEKGLISGFEIDMPITLI
jgi:uncharacterized repeat protein (TIGR02059 family)